MITGPDIARRIETLMRSTPKKTTTDLGGLFVKKDNVSSQAKRKQYATLIRHLREEKIIAELRIVANYLGVTTEYLLLGTDGLALSPSPPRGNAERLQHLAIQMEKVMKKLAFIEDKL